MVHGKWLSRIYKLCFSHRFGWRFPVLPSLKNCLDQHVAQFVKELDWDLADKAITLEDLWINILPEGGTHSGHIHPHSVISGTTYIAMPENASDSFEDPRLPQMMAAPRRKTREAI